MTYTSLMVHCELGQSNETTLRCASDLAARFKLHVIGIAVAQPLQMMLGDYYISAGSVDDDSKVIEAKAAATEAEFRRILQPHASQLSWRWATVFGTPATYLAQHACGADFLMTSASADGATGTQRPVSVGDLILLSGRPVMIVPVGPVSHKFDHVLVGWKDTREARRAVADALPLLKKAAQVTVVQIAAEVNLHEVRAKLAEVARWFKGHSIDAEMVASPSTGHDAKSFDTIAQRQHADLIVAGAYGHSRLREWAFGGFTSELMHPKERCVFVSH